MAKVETASDSECYTPWPGNPQDLRRQNKITREVGTDNKSKEKQATTAWAPSELPLQHGRSTI
jgi:hypothetical protein